MVVLGHQWTPVVQLSAAEGGRIAFWGVFAYAVLGRSLAWSIRGFVSRWESQKGKVVVSQSVVWVSRSAQRGIQGADRSTLGDAGLEPPQVHQPRIWLPITLALEHT